MNNNKYYKVISSLEHEKVKAVIFDHNDRIVESRIFCVNVIDIPFWRGMCCSKTSNKEYLLKAAHKYADKIIELCQKYETNTVVTTTVDICKASGDK